MLRLFGNLKKATSEKRNGRLWSLVIPNEAIACVPSPSGAKLRGPFTFPSARHSCGFCRTRVCWRFHCVLGVGEEKEKRTPALGREKLNIYLVIQNTYQSLDFQS